MALREPRLDLTVPVGPGRDVDARHEALDAAAAEPVQCVAHGHREGVVLVLVADEDAELVFRWPFHGPSRRPCPACRTDVRCDVCALPADIIALRTRRRGQPTLRITG